MKTHFRLLLAAALLAGCSRAADPTPTPAQIAANNPDAPGATYTDAAGVTLVMSQVTAASVTAPPLFYNGPSRRAVVFMGLLPNQTQITVSYSYTGNAFAGAGGNGRITLDAPVALYVTPLGVGGHYDFEMPASATTFVDIVAMNTVSATYTGPMVKNGSNGTFIFNHIAL